VVCPRPQLREANIRNGRPGRWPGRDTRFGKICRTQGISEKDYTVIEGFYDESLGRIAPGWAPTDIALAYVDFDMHSSTRVLLNLPKPRLKRGMINALDDYYCWTKDQI
jgi:hypothetical protein